MRPSKGQRLKFTGEFKTVDDGAVAGYQGKASVEGAFDRALETLAGKADVKLPPGIDKGSFKLDLEFADLPLACPDSTAQGQREAQGRRSLDAKRRGSITHAGGHDRRVLQPAGRR